jgi:hypothetical protein
MPLANVILGENRNVVTQCGASTVRALSLRDWFVRASKLARGSNPLMVEIACDGERAGC